MRKIVLIACASKKATIKAKAKDLYVSTLFAANMRYARSLKPDSIYILSAKYGLLELDTEIEPYNMTLKNMRSAQIKEWANKVLEQLKEHSDLQNDHFIFLAGEKYRKYLTSHMKSYEVPLSRMRIGDQLHYLSAQPYEPDL